MITNDFSDSIVQLSDEQFSELERDGMGFVINLHLCYHVMTEGQLELLNASDQRIAYDWLDEERKGA